LGGHIQICEERSSGSERPFGASSHHRDIVCLEADVAETNSPPRYFTGLPTHVPTASGPRATRAVASCSGTATIKRSPQQGDYYGTGTTAPCSLWSVENFFGRSRSPRAVRSSTAYEARGQTGPACLRTGPVLGRANSPGKLNQRLVHCRIADWSESLITRLLLCRRLLDCYCAAGYASAYLAYPVPPPLDACL